MSERSVHDRAVELIARILCRVVGIAEVDVDGSANWWIFVGDAEALVSDAERRFPPPPGPPPRIEN